VETMVKRVFFFLMVRRDRRGSHGDRN
jgi:hypothetical protein